MIIGMMPRAYMISVGFPFDTVYPTGNEEQAVQDYELLYDLFTEYHNAIRTFWRSGRQRELDPLSPILTEPERERRR